MNDSASNYDLLYNPRLTVADHPQITARWQGESAKARGALECYLDVPYGAGEAQRLDIFRSQGPSRGTLVFIHGGYWRALDKSQFSFIAPALTAAGLTLAIPNYALCPAVEVRDIVMQMVQACAWLHRNATNFGAPAGRLYVSGHSAGGHLTAMMLCALWPTYAPDLPAKTVLAGLSISGLYDLTEIVKTPSINADVRLTEKAAIQVSPAFLPPATDAPLHTAVGSEENQGFHLQNRMIGQAWRRVHRRHIECRGANHFTVLDRLADRDGELCSAVMEMVETAPG